MPKAIPSPGAIPFPRDAIPSGGGPVCAVPLTVIPISPPPVPGPPVGILFPEVRTTSVQLIWQPPAAPNGIILGMWGAVPSALLCRGCRRPVGAGINVTGQGPTPGHPESTSKPPIAPRVGTTPPLLSLGREEGCSECCSLPRSLPAHPPPQHHGGQRGGRRGAEPQHPALHGHGFAARIHLPVPHRRADPQGLGRGGRSPGGDHGEERYEGCSSPWWW